MFVSHLHGDHFGGLPFLILDAQFAGRTAPLAVALYRPTARRGDGVPVPRFLPGPAPVRGRGDGAAPGRLRDHGPGCGRQAFQASHPSGAPALILRLTLGGRIIAYTGDTAWTTRDRRAAAGADLLIAEAYYWDKAVPHHLRHADLAARRASSPPGVPC